MFVSRAAAIAASGVVAVVLMLKARILPSSPIWAEASKPSWFLLLLYVIFGPVGVTS